MTTTEKAPTNFVKILRPDFDKVVRAGTPEFIKRLPSLTTPQLEQLERWVNDLRAQKKENTYLVFPVRQAKQLDAGRLYLRSMSAFRTAVRDELASRAMTTMIEPEQTDLLTELLAA